MHTFKFSQNEIETCDVRRFRKFLDDLGFKKTPFPQDLAASVSLEFEGFQLTDRAVTDQIFRKFASSDQVVALPLSLFCTLTTQAYRVIIYARMQRLTILERKHHFTYRPDKIEINKLCSAELMIFEDLAHDLGFACSKLHEYHSFRLEEYLEAPPNLL